MSFQPMGSTGVPVTDPEVTEVRLAPDICALSRSESKRLAPENCAFFKSAFGPTRYPLTKFQSAGRMGMPFSDPEVTSFKLAPDIWAPSKSVRKRLAPDSCASLRLAS